MRDGIERNSGLSGVGNYVDVFEAKRRLPVLRRHFHDHVILIELRVDGGDFGLTEGHRRESCPESAV